MAIAMDEFPMEREDLECARIAWLLAHVRVECSLNQLRGLWFSTPNSATHARNWVTSRIDQAGCACVAGSQIRVQFGKGFVMWLCEMAAHHKLSLPERFSHYLIAARSQQAREVQEIRLHKQDLVNKLEVRDGRTGCFDCGAADNLEFDHLDRQRARLYVSKLLHCHKWSDAETEATMHCQLRCTPCHRRKSLNGGESKGRPRKPPTNNPAVEANRARARQWRHKRVQQGRIRLLNTKIRIGECRNCQLICTADNVQNFEFDHADAFKKRFSIGSSPGVSDIVFHEEVAKCRLLCVSCHRLHTALQRADDIIGTKVRATNKRKLCV
jgi:hypothetical protein